MCMTVGRARSLAVSAAFALAIFIASTASLAAETSEAFIIPLFPQKGGGPQERSAARHDRLQFLGRPRHGEAAPAR